MRCITYAGETVITTDDVAEVLVDLTAAIASAGRADAVGIPIVFEGTDEVGEAELVIGVGNDVLSVPVRWEGAEPDFSDAAAALRRHPLYPSEVDVVADTTFVDDPDMYWDPDLDGFDRR
ncbi:hypothetical protein [Microbacterium dauci]|uniref:Uncharacterized protein n=1 Tax=Microbacterium dauci TaxID=3048008 RepID=A0ABT6ZDE8_9MICO|nr:hypothetical protein [Microbacterium sp. LX3-4]MDJ1114192.1 hypothetical protein [Microbacterium sp. LX3-4]